MSFSRLASILTALLLIGVAEAALADEPTKTPLDALAGGQKTDDKKADDPDPAFHDELSSQLPFSASEVLELAKRLDQIGKAAQHPYGTPPRIENTSKTLNVTPGAGATEVYLAPGYPTDITFVDSTGQPWQVEHIGIGEKDKLAAEVTTPDGPTVELTPKVAYPMPLGLSITLKGLVQPILFRLTTNEKNFVNMAVTARIPQYGPAAKIPLIDRRERLVASDPVLETVLDGQPPQGATRMRLTGAGDGSSAWVIDGALYLRTRYALLSPRYDGITRSPDGMTAYVLRNIQVITLSIDGNPTRVHLAAVTPVASNGR